MYLVHVWSGHFDFLLLFVDFSWRILKSSSGSLHSSSCRSNATPPAQSLLSREGEPAVVCMVLCLERVRHLCLVIGLLQLSSGASSAFNTNTERAGGSPSHPAVMCLAAGQEEAEWYLAQDLFLPLVDVNKKQLMISALLPC